MSDAASYYRNNQRGFTLVELVMVLVLLGVMAVSIGGFITLSSQTFVNVSSRDQALSNVRFVIERLNREVRNAVPNSVRIAGNCLEFIPIQSSAFYTELPTDATSKSDQITAVEFYNQSGSNEYMCELHSGVCADVVSVYGLNEAALYKNVHSALAPDTGQIFSIKSIAAASGNTKLITLNKNVAFEDESPTKRLYIMNSPVSFCHDGDEVWRYENYDINDAQQTPPVSNSIIRTGGIQKNLMAANITSLQFFDEPATLSRNARVKYQITTKTNEGSNSDNISFMQTINLRNVP